MLAFRTKDLFDRGLLAPRFFRHNASLEVLETFDVDAEHVTMIVRVRRKRDAPQVVALEEKKADLLSRYSLDYFQVLRTNEEGREFIALIKQRTSRALQGIIAGLSMEAFPTSPTILREDETIVSLCARDDDLAQVLDLLRPLQLPFTVRSTGRYKSPATPWTADLTERQREILRLALESGYYEVPARISLTDLAKAVGISKAAMSKGLRRAEGRILRALIYGSEP